jgi:hypothetical protein
MRGRRGEVASWLVGWLLLLLLLYVIVTGMVDGRGRIFLFFSFAVLSFEFVDTRHTQNIIFSHRVRGGVACLLTYLTETWSPGNEWIRVSSLKFLRKFIK